MYAYLLAGTLIYYCSNVPPSKALFINASKSSLLISITANGEQVVLSDRPEGAAYLLGDYALMRAISCTDTLSLSSEYQNEFIRTEGAVIAFFDQQLLVVNDEAVKNGCHLDVDVLILRSFRKDWRALNEHFSPAVVLLDPRIYRRHRNLLREKWEDLDVRAIDLSADVYTQSFD